LWPSDTIVGDWPVRHKAGRVLVPRTAAYSTRLASTKKELNGMTCTYAPV